MILSPCKDCKEREFQCHSKCDKYKKFKRELEEYNKRVREHQDFNKLSRIWK